MRHFGFFAPLILALATFAMASAQASPQPGTWAQIPNTAIWPVLPPEATRELWSPRGIYAYSGGDIAKIKEVWGFLYWGGGHADGPNNALYWAPFDGSGPKCLSGPWLAPKGSTGYYPNDGLDYYLGPSRNQPGITAGGAPKSRHTYSGIVTVTVDGKPYFLSVGGGIQSSGGHGTKSTWLFDLSQTYAQAMARPDMGWVRKADSPYTLTASAGWDSKAGLVVVRGRASVDAYNPKTNSWAQWAPAGGGSDYEASVAMDVEGRKMYVLGGNIAEVIDLDKHTLTVLGTFERSKAVLTGPEWIRNFVTPYSMSPTAYVNGPGVAWHPGRKRLLVYGQTLATSNTGKLQDIIQIDPVTGKVETLTMGGVTVGTQPGYSINGRFRLIPGTDTVVLSGSVETHVFIGQLPAGGGTTPVKSR
jgi:hypothetical protein